ncbi:O-antigen ligase family protein [Frigidibacter sp. ROC022]|uniref:O-antigen ligase family protein n=1 Tax=Frigidibacter sp. ROC022 TaxID=2971796 RepID=UPI00215B2B7A|nr:O-antigen ligase family protein [Frigidibacter sp. ROC022]MCR8723854.1 O-antigen ligase family protein [Frigidibacter sp. ROC022]
MTGAKDPSARPGADQATEPGLRQALHRAAARGRARWAENPTDFFRLEPPAAPAIPPEPARLSDPAGGRADPAPEERMRPVNRVVAGLLTGIVLLAPLPAGSDRPAAWMLWSTVLHATACLYLARTAATGALGGMKLRRFPLLLLPLLLLGYGLLQTLPLAGLLRAWMLPLPDTGAPAPRSISLAPEAGRIGLLRMSASCLFFVLMLEASGRRDRAQRIGMAIIAGIALYAVWGIVALKLLGDVHFWGPKQAYRGVATGPFVNRNSFATFLGMGAVLGLAMIVERTRSRQVTPAGRHTAGPETVSLALMWSALALILICLVATQSRMGLLATVLGLAVVVAISPRRPGIGGAKRTRRRWRIGLGPALLLGLGLLASSGIVERSLFTLNNADTRVEIYRQVLAMLADRPLTGFGADSFALAFELYHRPALATHLVWDHPHSSYLTLWSDFGLIFGSLLPLAGLAAGLHLARVLAGRREAVALVVAALAVLVQNAVHSLVDFSLEMQANLFVFLAILALGLSRRRLAVAASNRQTRGPAQAPPGTGIGA